MESLYREPAYYRRLFAERTADVPLYLEVTEGVTEPVLELGVGAGRMALPLARAGRRIIGVDREPAMVAALRESLAEESDEVAARLEVVEADVTTLDLGRRFSRVLCPFNGLAHSPGAEDLARFFAAVHRHLAPGGRFVFDVMLPDPALMVSPPATVPFVEHPRTGAACRLDERYDYDHLRQVLTVTTTFTPRDGSPPQTLELSLRQFFPEETQVLLAHHGFTVVQRDGRLGDSLAYVCRQASPA